MSISARSIPHGTKVTIWAEPVLGQQGLMVLSPRIASVFARWSSLEKQLNQLFTLITDADAAARTAFDGLKGWDRRVDMIGNEAEARLDEATADIVNVVLRLVKVPAGKRDELAHRMWAVAEGFESELALLPADNQHILAEAVVAAKKAGNCNVPIETSPIFNGSSLVSAADLDLLILEFQQAADRMDCLIRGHLYPSFADATGAEFSDCRRRLAEDVEVSARIVNVANERRRVEKAARRAAARAQFSAS